VPVVVAQPVSVQCYFGRIHAEGLTSPWSAYHAEKCGDLIFAYHSPTPRLRLEACHPLTRRAKVMQVSVGTISPVPKRSGVEAPPLIPARA
jgi:hypothetical protein